jgi:hypothetical protein
LRSGLRARGWCPPGRPHSRTLVTELLRARRLARGSPASLVMRVAELELNTMRNYRRHRTLRRQPSFALAPRSRAAKMYRPVKHPPVVAARYCNVRETTHHGAPCRPIIVVRRRTHVRFFASMFLAPERKAMNASSLAHAWDSSEFALVAFVACAVVLWAEAAGIACDDCAD